MSLVLINCECSGVVRRAFRALGHDAWSCDLQPADDGSPYHYQADAIEVAEREYWDLMIAHPPCTYLSNSGVHLLYNANHPHRWEDMELAAEFFLKLLYARKARRIAVENPIMHGHALDIIGVEATQFIQPWWFGVGETKATGLWLRELPKLVPTHRPRPGFFAELAPSGRRQRIMELSPSPTRAKERSETYDCIGQAMAQQWGRLLV